MEQEIKDDDLKNVIGGTGENEETECPKSPNGKHEWGNISIGGGETIRACMHCGTSESESNTFFGIFLI